MIWSSRKFLRWYSGWLDFIVTVSSHESKSNVIPNCFSSILTLVWNTRVISPIFMTVLWITAHTISSQNKWTQHALWGWGHSCSPDLLMANVFPMNELPLPHYFLYFDLFHWFLLSRSCLGGFGEFLLSISWEEGSQRYICVHMFVSKYMYLQCGHTYIYNAMHIRLWLCWHFWVPVNMGLHIHTRHCWSVLYTPNDFEDTKSVV